MNPSLKLLRKIFKDKKYIEVSEEYFLESNIRQIYVAIQKYYVSTDTIPTDTFFIQSIIPKIEKDENVKKQLKEIVSNLPDTVDENISELLDLMEESYKKISLSRLTKELATALKNDDFSIINEIIGKMDAVQESGTADYLEPINEDFSNHQAITRIPTGLISSDINFNSIPESSVVLIGARTGLGKTATSLMMGLRKFFFDNANVAIWSYEMPLAQIRSRALSAFSKVPYHEVETNTYVLEESKLRVEATSLSFTYNITPDKAYDLLVKEGVESIHKLPKRKNRLFFRGAISKKDLENAKKKGKKIKGLPNNEEILKEIKQMHKVYGLDVIIIDYLQLVPKVKAKSREEGLTALVEDIKSLCLETGILALLPVQTEKTRPLDVKYSKGLENSADIFFALIANKDLETFNTIAIGIPKNRHGKAGIAILYENHLDRMWLEPIDDTPQDLYEFVKEEKMKG